MRVFLACNHPDIISIIESLESEKGINKLKELLGCDDLYSWAKPLLIVDQALYRERVLSKAQLAKPDVIVLYDKLPGQIDLENILDELRIEVKNKDGQDTRIIFITSLEQGSPLLRKAVEIGVWDIISGKDIDVLEIIQRIYKPNNYSSVAHFRLASDEDNRAVYIPKYVEREKVVEKEVEVVKEKEVKVVHRVGNIKGMKETIVFWSPFESGKTTISVNIASAMAQMGLKTILFDADLENRTLENYFNLKPAEKYALAVGITTKMEPREILKRCHTYKRNLKVLAFSSGMMEKPEITPEEFQYIYDGLRRDCDIFIIDVAKDPESLLTKAAINTASRVIVVCTLDPYQAKVTSIKLNMMGANGVALNKFEGLINKSVKIGVSKNEIREILELEFAPVDIPAVPEITCRSIFEGVPAYDLKPVPELFVFQINTLANYYNEGDSRGRKLQTERKSFFDIFIR